jgi:hypothetical protein
MVRCFGGGYLLLRVVLVPLPAILGTAVLIGVVVFLASLH